MECLSTPFGARRLRPADVVAQANAGACPPAARVDKWAIVKALVEARDRFGVSDRAVAVLAALVSFAPDEAVTPGLVVFPSNRVLSLRAHGMAAPTLRRHIAALVDAGLVIRRDSPNGKRYARSGEDGAVAAAYGFDLTPLAARADEIERAAAAVRAEARAAADLRDRVTVLRRDVGKAALLLAELEPGFDPLDHSARNADLLGRRLRGLGLDALADLAFGLGRLKADLDKRLSRHLLSEKTSADDAGSERHIQNSNPRPSDSEPLKERERADAAAPSPFEARPVGDEGGGRRQATGGPPPGRGHGTPGRSDPAGRGAAGPRRPPDAADDEAALPRIDLPAVLAACPDLKDWSTDAVRSWEDLVRAAERVRPALGVSPDAWAEAVGAMGESGAAVTLVTILQRAPEIASPGGYLRALSRRAREGRYSPAPVVVSLLRRRVKAEGVRAGVS